MVAIPQRSFARGEISKAFQARADLQVYGSALAACTNAIIRSDGGWMNRAGFLFKETTKNNGAVFTIPWQFDQGGNQSCFLELGENYLRVLVRGELVNPSSAAAWNNVTGYLVGNVVTHSGVQYYCKADNLNQTPPNATYWYPMPAGIFEIPTPWTLSQLAGIYYDQNQNKIIFVRAGGVPYELTCTGALAWVLAPSGTAYEYFGSSISTPSGLTIDTGGTGIVYYVTAVSKTDGTESLAATITTATPPSSGSPRTIGWTPQLDASGYNVYREDAAGLGLLGFVIQNGIKDSGLDTDKSERPPTHNFPFNAESITPMSNFPSVCAFSKQRLFVANIAPYYNSIWGSWLGSIKNFLRKVPLFANGPVSIPLTGVQSPKVNHLLDLAGLWILTDGAEVYCKGDGYGVITPGNINPEDRSAHGSCSIKPLKLSRSALFIQADQRTIRELGPQVQGGEEETDLTTFAKHLFERNVITGWCYQKSPHSIVWIVRNDGQLIGMTYVKSQQILAFHRHETDGVIENILSIKEDGEDAVYAVVRRTIEGATKRYHERLGSRMFDDIVDAVFMDSALSYDGRNTDESHTMLLSGGTAWDENEDLNLESSEAGYFDADEVGNVYRLACEDDAGNEIELDLEVVAYIDAENVTVRSNRSVPASIQDALTWEWTRCVDQLAGLDHLEGKAVSILGDGGVIASPNNPECPAFTVESGELSQSLGACYGVIHVGLPYISDLETLALETMNNETMANKKVIVGQVTAYLQDTRGLHFGAKLPEGDDPLEGMEVMRPVIEGYSQPAALQTGKVIIPIQGSWTKDGKCAARMVDPLPATINAIVPTGLIPA